MDRTREAVALVATRDWLRLASFSTRRAAGESAALAQSQTSAARLHGIPSRDMAASSRRSRSPLPLAHGSPSLSLQAIIQASRSDRPWAVITGASSGIGHALATEAARRGCNVVLVARRAAALADLAATLEQEHGALTQVVALDLARPESAEALHAATAPLAHRVELLVANAGRSWSGPLASQPAEVSGCIMVAEVH